MSCTVEVTGGGEGETASVDVHEDGIDALAPYGVEHLDLPFTPERIWRAISHKPKLTT